MNYVMMFVGLLIMCVPEDASLLRFTVQAGIGLFIFISAVIPMINSTE